MQGRTTGNYSVLGRKHPQAIKGRTRHCTSWRSLEDILHGSTYIVFQTRIKDGSFKGRRNSSFHGFYWCGIWNLGQILKGTEMSSRSTGTLLPVLPTALTTGFTNVEQAPINRCLQLPAPFKRLIEDINNRQTTHWFTPSQYCPRYFMIHVQTLINTPIDRSKRTNHCLVFTANYI